MVRRSGDSNRIRIIGGQHRGRKISFPDAQGLRPTADRIRETLFNWLSPTITGARCLDLFAGSGVLGFEAASRGANRVVMIEKNRKVIDQLCRNREVLGLEQVEVIHADALNWMDENNDRFDVVFADPPFSRQMLPSILQALRLNHTLAPDAAIYIESDVADPFPTLPTEMTFRQQKRAGQVLYGLIQFQPPKISA
jgi:16S rRNA (guanine966-N2)-methyltransferase